MEPEKSALKRAVVYKESGSMLDFRSVDRGVLLIWDHGLGFRAWGSCFV